VGRAHNSLVIDMPTPAASAQRASSPPAWPQRFMLGGLIATLIISPLLFGTTEPWSIFIQRTLGLLLLCLWVADQVSQQGVNVSKNPVYLPFFLFVTLALMQLALGVTSYPYATLSEIPSLAIYGVLILVAGELMTRRRNLRTLVFSLSVFGFVLAVFAIVQGFSGTLKIYGFRSTSSLSASIFGPYANHNHYAGLMEMLVPLAAASAILESGAKRSLLVFGAVIMAVSIVFSRSRGGMIALACCFLFVCVLLLRTQRRRRGLIAAFVVCMLFATLVLLLGTDRIFDRLLETQDQYRFRIYGDSLRMIVEKPILGYGSGTFQYVYPQFQSFWTNLLVNHAHNDYLELLIEYGILGAALFLWMIVAVIRVGFCKLKAGENDEGGLLSFAAMAGIVAMLVHSLFDFNLHIPANAALFFVLCAAVAAPFKHRVQQQQVQPWTHSADEEVTTQP
jgi:O-antigen ligase